MARTSSSHPRVGAEAELGDAEGDGVGEEPGTVRAVPGEACRQRRRSRRRAGPAPTAGSGWRGRPRRRRTRRAGRTRRVARWRPVRWPRPASSTGRPDVPGGGDDDAWSSNAASSSTGCSVIVRLHVMVRADHVPGHPRPVPQPGVDAPVRNSIVGRYPSRRGASDRGPPDDGPVHAHPRWPLQVDLARGS